MYGRELALEILTQIYESTQTILKRFAPVKSVEDFTGSDAGMGELDANNALSGAILREVFDFQEANV